jgi:hypothetical protein
MKILWHEMHIKAKREPYAAFVLSTHMYDWQNWQGIWQHPNRKDLSEMRAGHCVTVSSGFDSDRALARLTARVNRNLDENRLTGAIFLGVTKVFDTVWVERLLQNLTILNFATYLVAPHPPTSKHGRFKRPTTQSHPFLVACRLEWFSAD